MQRIILLGAPRIDGPGGPITGPATGGRHLAVLALLARAGAAGVPRERITALLWPESDAERARHSLEQVAYVLRRALGTDAIASAGSALLLETRVADSDLREFLAASDAGRQERAASLYGGAFLDAFHLSGAPEFERWVDVVRAELHRRWGEALRQIAEQEDAARDHGRAADAWRRLVAAEPLGAPATLGLMRALDAAGDRSAALAAARAHEERLRTELDAAPDPAVAKLAVDLREPAQTAASRPRPREMTPDGVTHQDPPPRDWRRKAASLSFATTAALALGLLAATLGGSDSALEKSERDSAAPRVIVTSFVAEPGDSVPGSAGRMAADWIRQGLARTGLVEVAASLDEGSSGHSSDVRVAGRVYRSRDSLWFQAWIAGGDDGAVLRTMDPVRAPAGDPVAALEPLRQQVLGAIGTLFDPRLQEWAGVALRPPTYRAYRAFALGMEAFAARDLRRAGEEFRRSAELDRGYAQPRLWGAWSCVMMGELHCADSLLETMPIAESLSPLEQAWRARIGALLRGDTEASFQAARRMVQLSPGSGWAMALHNSAMDTRRGRLALKTLEDLGPEGLGLVGSYYWASVSRAHHLLGNLAAALAVAEEGMRAGSRQSETVVALAASLGAVGDTARLRTALAEADALAGLDAVDRASAVFAGAVELRAHGHGAAAPPLLGDAADRFTAAAEQAPGDRHALAGALASLHEAGRWDDLSRFVTRHADAVPAADRLGIAGHAAARRGDRAGAARADDALAALEERFLFGDNTLWRARIAAVLAEHDRAVRLLRQAIGEGVSGATWHQLHYARDLDPLRGRRDFQDLMRPRGAGLPAESPP